MKSRIFHTSINLLIEPGLYTKLKMIATMKKTSMSKIIRAGISLWIDQYEKANNIIQTKKEDMDHECSDSEENRK